MSFAEQAFCFQCGRDELLGIITAPANPEKTGVLIVVGGPQYRVGSHRQFFLLSRSLAEAAYPVMRFDSRGMGDSAGDLRNFEATTEDISSAIDAFFKRSPQMDRVVLWGLCDAATAALTYEWAKKDSRLGGFVLLNPWVRSEATLAQTHIKHYYTARLLQLEFWQKLFSGKLGIIRALSGFLGNLKAAQSGSSSTQNESESSFQEKMVEVLDKTQLPVLLILSGNDFVAKEFSEHASASSKLTAILQRPMLTQKIIPEADHTFSCAEWRGLVEQTTLSWLNALDHGA